MGVTTCLSVISYLSDAHEFIAIFMLPRAPRGSIRIDVTFSISTLIFQSVLLVEETSVTRKNHTLQVIRALSNFITERCIEHTSPQKVIEDKHKIPRRVVYNLYRS
jgi:hypothetical protein